MAEAQENTALAKECATRMRSNPAPITQAQVLEQATNSTVNIAGSDSSRKVPSVPALPSPSSSVPQHRPIDEIFDLPQASSSHIVGPDALPNPESSPEFDEFYSRIIEALKISHDLSTIHRLVPNLGGQVVMTEFNHKEGIQYNFHLGRFMGKSKVCTMVPATSCVSLTRCLSGSCSGRETGAEQDGTGEEGSCAHKCGLICRTYMPPCRSSLMI
jgi:hypothetical protein